MVRCACTSNTYDFNKRGVCDGCSGTRDTVLDESTGRRKQVKKKTRGGRRHIASVLVQLCARREREGKHSTTMRTPAHAGQQAAARRSDAKTWRRQTPRGNTQSRPRMHGDAARADDSQRGSAHKHTMTINAMQQLSL
jgi:hypothetical protein